MGSPPEGRYISFVLRVNSGGEDAVFNGQIALADGRKVGLADGSYVVRVWVDPDGHRIRGAIRGEKTGRTLRFQSGDRVAEFIRGCLSHPPAAADSGSDQPSS